MSKVLISKNIPAIANELLKKAGFTPETLNSDVSLSSLDPLQLQEVVGIISMLADPIDDQFLEKTPQLKVISNYAVGFNNLDLVALQKRNILVGNTPEVLTEATAELTVGLLLMSMRNLTLANRAVYDGSWQGFRPLDFLGPTLFRKKVGIMGFGRIGKKVGEILHFGFQNPISIINRGDEKNQQATRDINYPLHIFNEDEFLKDLDILILNSPLNESTHNWLNENRLQKLKTTATIINTGRGDLVDEEALVRFLKKHPDLRYGTDVMKVEPLPTTHEFTRLANVTLLPHIGSASIEAREAMAVICAKNIIMGINEGRVFKGPLK